jgi:hypothetical protein
MICNKTVAIPKEFDNYHRMLQATNKVYNCSHWTTTKHSSLLRFKEDIKLDKKVILEARI